MSVEAVQLVAMLVVVIVPEVKLPGGEGGVMSEQALVERVG